MATAIYLSPHYDDVCFSLGIAAKAGEGGHLINVFTDCNYVDPLHAQGASPADIATLRDAEDKVFADMCTLKRHNLGLPEATVKGLHPFDLGGVEEEVRLVEQPLLALLSDLLNGSDSSEKEIYCPLGTGCHRNHISVFLVIIKFYAALRKKCKIFFYEDLPYASHIETRKEAIHRLHYHFKGASIVRHANQLEADEMDEKLRLVSLYQSQHDGRPVQKHFVPDEPLTPFPHEAFWEVT
jgi:hypothetical protein